MKRSRKLWLLGSVVGIAILLVGGTWLVVGTDTGTRWLLRQAEGYLPDELQIGEAAGSLLSGIRFDTVEWRDDSVHVSVRQLELNIELAPLFMKRIAIDTLDAERVDVRILDSGDAGGDGSLPDVDLPVSISIAEASARNVSVVGPDFATSVDRISLSGRIVGSDLAITRLAVRSDWLKLDLHGKAELSGSYPHNFNLNWEWLQSEELRLVGHLLLSGNVGTYDVQHSLTAPVALTTNGTVSFDSGVLFADLLNQWEQMEWVVGERTVSSSGGTLSLRGDTTKFALELDALAQTGDVPETAITLQGEAGRESMRIDRLDLASSLGRASVSGEVAWLPVPTVDLNFGLIELDPELAFSEVIEAVGLQGSVKGSYADDTFTLADSVVQIGSNHSTATGTIGKNLVLDADFDLPAIGELALGATGSLKASVSINGPSTNPNARVNINGQLGIGDTALEAIAVSASGNLEAHTVRAVIEAGRNKVEVDAAGGYAQDGWIGTVDSLAVTNSEFGRWSNQQPAELTASPEIVALSRVCLQGASIEANACLSFDYRNDGTAMFDASIAQLPLAALPFQPPQNVSMTGFVEAKLRGQLNDQGLTGEATIELLETTASTTFEDEVISVAVADAVSHTTIADNRLESITRFELADGAGNSGLDFIIEDVTDSQSAIQASGTVAISDASLFAVFVPAITKPHGTIDGSLSATGSLSAPEFSGEIALQKGSFGVRQAGLEIHDIEVRLQQHSTGRLQLAGSARSGEGLVSIQGNTVLGRDTGIRTELLITGDNFELVRLPDAQIAASPSISVVLDERAALVTGELAIPNANLRIEDIPETAVSASPDATVHSSEAAASPLGRRIDVNVSTLLGDNVRLDAFGLKTGIEGTVKIEGGSHKPYLGFGRLSLRDGRYKAYGQELTIERGELIFNGPLDNPNLDVRATRSVNDVVAGIQLTGTPIQLRSTLFSEPALGDAEILSYLLTGRALSSSTTTGEGDALNKAAFALGLSQAGSITSQIRGSLGLETLTVEGGAEDGKIVAGKRIGDRLLVEYGYGLIDKLGTLLLRYQLSDRLVLESRTGTVSNLDILYRVKKE